MLAASSAVRAALARESGAGASMALRACGARRWASKKKPSSDAVEFELNTPYKAHLFEGPTSTKATATKEEMLGFHEMMFRIRRMEVSFDKEYKNKAIRGFCHLSDGQEAVAVALQAGLSKTDSITTAYRCHGIALARGDTVEKIAAELFGFYEGSSKGKGGSMHLYSKERKFWGGAGIVGAQVPVGAGVGFAQKYLAELAGEKEFPVSVVMYGDGAANQGQIWEAANMSKLWNLPNIFLCENNQYGMGTSTDRHSCNPNYYTAGGMVIPGIKVDGMDVLAVRDAISWAKDYCGSGNGPIYMEVNTYRYHGHSMSDPGISYRERDEVQNVRKERDCIELVKRRILEAGWATEAEIKDTEKEIRKEVDEAFKRAKKGTKPPTIAMYEDIFHKEIPSFIRGVERGKPFVNKD